jgi:hypothetical protein
MKPRPRCTLDHAIYPGSGRTAAAHRSLVAADGPNVQAARKVCAYEGWQQNLSWRDIQKEDRIKFGTQHRKLSRRSIQQYVSNGEKLRNAAYVK